MNELTSLYRLNQTKSTYIYIYILHIYITHTHILYNTHSTNAHIMRHYR